MWDGPERRGPQPHVQYAEWLPDGNILFVLVWPDGRQMGLRVAPSSLRFERGQSSLCEGAP